MSLNKKDDSKTITSCWDMLRNYPHFSKVLEQQVQDIIDIDREKQLGDVKQILDVYKDKSYRFTDVFFKTISWLLSIGALDAFRKEVTHGLGWYVISFGELFGFLSVATFLFFRIFFLQLFLVVRLHHRPKTPVRIIILVAVILVALAATYIPARLIRIAISTVVSMRGSGT